MNLRGLCTVSSRKVRVVMEFVPIEGFPNYSVSMDGMIRNEETHRPMALTVNTHGVVQVGMMRDGNQHKRSVALIVAKTFLDPPYPETFDTPIHLDGDRFNNRVDNLMWRPRWFAVKYGQQFERYAIEGPQIKSRIMCLHSKIKFKNSWDAATKFGLIDREILMSALNRTRVWPTYQEFVIL